MIKNELSMAIIDNGINDMYKPDLSDSIYFNLDGKVIHGFNNSTFKFQHGTTCYLIFRKYNKKSNIYNIQILDSNGNGEIEKLASALEWCVKRNIRVINLSLGSSHFKDKDILRNIINHYANKGLIIIAAASNKGVITYPASFTNVIGVCSNNGNNSYEINKNTHIGIDVMAPSVHKIVIGDTNYYTQQSNSYAAPFISAKIIDILKNTSLKSIFQIKTELYRLINITFKSELYCFYPDWVENAFIDAKLKKSKASFYFNSVENYNYNDVKEKIDTIIIDTEEKLNLYKNKDKKIIYLGDCFNYDEEKNLKWSKKNRINQILNSSKCNEELQVPVIILDIKNDIDDFFLLTELRKQFSYDGYNLYCVSFETESVLYDLEYIPEMSKEYNDWGMFVRQFICSEILYKQSDAVMISINNCNYRRKVFVEEFQIVISISGFDEIFIRIRNSENNSINCTYKCINSESIKNLYMQILKLI